LQCLPYEYTRLHFSNGSSWILVNISSDEI
jgi:hypothetical protein